MAWNVNDVFSGRPSARPTSAKASAGKRSSSSISNKDGGLHNSSSSSSASGPPTRARSGQAAQGGVINSALWAIARTRALVDAVEHVEAKYGDAPVLSGMLHTLRRADLNDASSIRQAADAASSFLQSNPCQYFTPMHPIDVIRGIVGTCTDSEEVFKAALTTTYRIAEKCTLCSWKEAKGTATEDKFECTTSDSVQMAIELRSAHNIRTGICEKCQKKSVAKRYRIERTAPCFVATWTSLAKAKPARESLFILTSFGESLRFSLAVMIAFCDRKAVCLFSEGSNYYKVEGSSVKVITKSEWQNTQPCLALFSRQGAGDRGGGLSSFAYGGGAKAGKKRQREENGYGQYSASSSGGGSRAQSAATAVAAAAEVIELDDDDTDGGDANVPVGGSGRGKDASSSRQNGSGSSFGNGQHEPSSPGVASENGATASRLKGEGEGERERGGAGRERKVARTTAPDGGSNDKEVGRSGSSSVGVPDAEPSTITGAIKRMFTGRSDAGGWLRRANTSGSSTVREGESPGGEGGRPGSAASGAAATEPREPPEVHNVDDEVDPRKEDEASASKGKRHPSGVPMPFIGPARPPPAAAAAAAAGRALPPRPKPLHLPQGEQRRSSSYSQSPWLTSRTKPRSESNNQDIRRNFVGGAFPNGGGRRLGGSSWKGGSGASSRGGGSGSGAVLGGGAAKGSCGQKTILSSWEKKPASSSHNGAGSGGSGGGNSSGDEAEWRPPGKAAAAAAGGGGSREGLRSSSREGKVLEDLTGADEVWEDMGDVKSAGVGGGGSASSVAGGGLGDETLRTIRGINLQQDHFERIVDSDGWLTSQIIDIRVKQLQDRYPQHLYFDSSFFGFLCPTTEKGGAFVVDYARVAGWTKQSRLPGGKSSLFDMRKLFIPINQGNVHWVLVVVDMDSDDKGGGGGGGGGGAKVVSFFDSFGREGTPYVEAVQQYLVSELSSRDKTRQELFTPRPRPPDNAPRQHNSSDCGVLMLHVMEELSTGPTDALARLTQGEIQSLRLHLVANILDDEQIS
ncbi:unnamed protein product [Ectocarpus sp. 4 AP-2014]